MGSPSPASVALIWRPTVRRLKACKSERTIGVLFVRSLFLQKHILIETPCNSNDCIGRLTTGTTDLDWIVHVSYARFALHKCTIFYIPVFSLFIVCGYISCPTHLFTDQCTPEELSHTSMLTSRHQHPSMHPQQAWEPPGVDKSARDSLFWVDKADQYVRY